MEVGFRGVEGVHKGRREKQDLEGLGTRPELARDQGGAGSQLLDQ